MNIFDILQWHHQSVGYVPPELKESLTRMGSDLKHGLMSSLKNAWQTLNDFARAHTSSAQLQAELAMVASRIKEEEEKQHVQEGERGRRHPLHYVQTPTNHTLVSLITL